MAIRFDESDVRSMGRTAHGVRGIALGEDDEVVSMVVANGLEDPASLLTVCERGYGKRTALTEYRSQNRGGKGLIDIKTTDRNGPVVAIAKVTDDDEVMLTTVGGNIIRTRVGDVNLIGRNTQGVRLIRIDEEDSVGSLAKLPEEELSADNGVDDAVAEAIAEAGAVDVIEGSADDEASPAPRTEHILNDGVGPAEASDHIDDLDADGEPDPE
jgi:DNA gyrase subunit A